MKKFVALGLSSLISLCVFATQVHAQAADPGMKKPTTHQKTMKKKGTKTGGAATTQTKKHKKKGTKTGAAAGTKAKKRY